MLLGCALFAAFLCDVNMQGSGSIAKLMLKVKSFDGWES